MIANRAFALAVLLLSLVLFGCAAASDSSGNNRHGFYGGISGGGSHI